MNSHYDRLAGVVCNIRASKLLQKESNLILNDFEMKKITDPSRNKLMFAETTFQYAGCVLVPLET